MTEHPSGQATVSITCEDGYQLAGKLYRPEATKGAVMIAPATGIRARFYDRFARQLQERDFGVLTFENRGIGDSLHEPLKQCGASLVSWGQLDMPAVLERLKQEFPDVSYHLVGHSAGGQLAGLMPNVCDLSSVLAVASSSGYLRNMPPAYRLQAFFFLNILLPTSCVVQGYGRSDLAGMGEPLPRNVARQWRDWCNGGGYVEVELKRDPTLQWYADESFCVPSLWVHASDDNIANSENVADMLRLFPGIDAEVRTLEPKSFSLQEIGHMSFFRNPTLWQEGLSWLEARISSQ